jgi:outer membrane protein OmpA-like peptidoglycan-associated protein
MKRLVLSLITLFLVLSVKAQYSSDLAVENQYPGDQKALKVYQKAIEKQANPKTSALRTTWVANRPCDNWFLSIRTGLVGILNSYETPHVTSPWVWFDDREQGLTWRPAAGVALGKWYSPVWGLRLDVDYGHVQKFDENATEHTGHIGNGRYYAVTGNFLFNLKNAFLPYNPKGFFNPVLYAGTGYLHVKPNDAWNLLDKGGNYTVTAKAGLQLNFRLCDAFDFFLDGSAWFVHDGFTFNAHPVRNTDVLANGEIGFTYRMNFRHFIKAPFYNADEIDALNRELNELRNRPQVVCPPVPVCPEPQTVVQQVVEKHEIELSPVFFTINSSVVRDNQLVSLARAAQYLLDNPNAKLDIEGYADKGTGTTSGNKKISENRANAVSTMLQQKFGIDKSRLKAVGYGDANQKFSENDKNRVVLFVR